MKFLLLALVLFVVACEKQEVKPSLLCPVVQIGANVVMNNVVQTIKTCNAQTLTNKILEQMKCPEVSSRSGLAKSVIDIKSMVCPLALSFLTDAIANGIQNIDPSCDQKILSDFLRGDDLCNKLFK